MRKTAAMHDEKPETKRLRAAPMGSTQNSVESAAAAALRPIRSLRAFEEISDQIRDQIRSGQLKSGDRLPPERDLAKTFMVSRTAVREALITLELSGQVKILKGRSGGAYVNEAGNELVTRSFQDLLSFGRISLASLLDARNMILEPLVRRACDRANSSDLADLERNVEELAIVTAEKNLTARSRVVVEFYVLLARATGNPVMLAIVNALSTVLQEHILVKKPRQHAETLLARRVIIKHLKARDADKACAAMKKYINRLNRHLMRENHTEYKELYVKKRVLSNSSTA
jgi:DNA-binding FadR family transcriptional regulator